MQINSQTPNTNQKVRLPTYQLHAFEWWIKLFFYFPFFPRALIDLLTQKMVILPSFPAFGVTPKNSQKLADTQKLFAQQLCPLLGAQMRVLYDLDLGLGIWIQPMCVCVCCVWVRCVCVLCCAVLCGVLVVGGIEFLGITSTLRKNWAGGN